MYSVEIAPGIHRVESVNGSNSVLLVDEQMAVVDTGISGNGDSIVKYIRSLGRSPDDLRWILVTHFHFDHSGSAAELHQLTGLDFDACADMIEKARESLQKKDIIGKNLFIILLLVLLPCAQTL